MAPESPAPEPGPRFARRGFLAGAALAVGALVTACGDGGSSAQGSPSTSAGSAPTSAPATVAPATVPPTTAPGPAQFVDTGPDEFGRVALTFHTSGDLGLAQQLLDVLAAHDAHITSFIVGSWLATNPGWAKKLTDAGHELANHTYTHPTFSSLSPEQMTTEITQCRDLLVRLTGSGGRYFRPSGTDDGTSTPAEIVLDLAGQAGYPVVLGFDCDPLDYQDPGADVVAQRTLATVHAGSIISLHFDHPGTIAAMPAILDGLAQRNLKAGTASELLA